MYIATYYTEKNGELTPTRQLTVQHVNETFLGGPVFYGNVGDEGRYVEFTKKK